MHLLASGCPEEPLGEYLESQDAALRSASQLSYQQFHALLQLVALLAHDSDDLTDRAAEMRHLVQHFIKGHYDWLEARTEAGQSEQAKEFRRNLRQFIKDQLKLEQAKDRILDYLNGVKRLAWLCRDFPIHPALINRLAYIARTALYDSDYAQEMLKEITPLQGAIPNEPVSATLREMVDAMGTMA